MEGGNTIRIVQSRIEAQLESFDSNPETMLVKTSSVCDDVRDQILNYEDEPHLSKSQNNHRRIFIASELFNSFCGIYAHVVDYEYTKIIRDVMQWEKYKRISRKITSKALLELRREKYFAGEAQSKLLRSAEDNRAEETVEGTPTEGEQMTVATQHERDSLPTGPEQVADEEAFPGQENNDTLAPPLEGSFRTELLSDIIGNLTEIREAMADATHLELPISPISRRELSLPNIEGETSIRAPSVEERAADDDIDRIRQILEDEIFLKDTADIQEPENLEEPANKSPVVEEIVPRNPPTGDQPPENQPTDAEPCQAVQTESSEGWSLPSLEEVENTRRRHRHLIIDRTTIIPDYAARALQLNRNICIQRIQVFEGPPSVLQAISANHLMTTPAYKRSLFRDGRSSKLSTLYNRHLEVEKKPVEETLLQRRFVEPRVVDISRVRAHTEILEDVGMRAGMHLRPERSDVLVDVPERAQWADLDLPTAGVPPKESLVGVPMSRIINSTIEPPRESQMDRINAVPEPTATATVTVQQLQGLNLDQRTSPPWFISTKENPPSEKYKKFNYVYEKLQTYWSMLESQGMEKRITIREFFSFEVDGSVADFLTVLRIVDKMSIQRKLLLEYKSGDAVVRPFEIPYVSEAQLLLKEKEPVF